MRIPSTTSHQFSQVPKAEIPRSSFNRSFGTKTTFDAGYLVPFMVDEVLPGDTFNVHTTGFARLATPITPFMDNLFMETFYFFVPNRLIWTNFQKFNGEQDNPDDSTDFLVPTMTAPFGGYAVQSLSDYFGIPVGKAGLVHMSLFHRAYNLIWNEWFRDENLQDKVVVDKDDGPDDPATYTLLKRGKRHDYFTSCLPWPQKGPAVDLPLTGNVPVYGTGKALAWTDGTTNFGSYSGSSNDVKGYSNLVGATVGGASGSGTNIPATKVIGIATSGDSGLKAVLSDVAAVTINQMRQAFQMQRLFERDARGGTRYTEIVRAHFGVISPDARLQRPEYLGGGSSMVNINPIAQTSATASQPTPQGHLSAIGTAAIQGHGFTKSFTEHGVILGLVCVRADLSYQQGLPRMFSRSTRYDFYWPALSHIGEQAVLNKEIYAQATADDNNVFGYQERYAEYRYKPSQITGKMRSNVTGSLDIWHLAQDFDALPVLNDSFIQENPPIARVLAVPSEPHFIFDSYTKMICARPMPVYSVPGLIDHF